MVAKSRLLTEAELELMAILWKLEEASVAEVIGGLPPGRDLAYTSVSTILRILEQKGAVKSRKEGRGHLYSAVLKKDRYESMSVRHLVERVFDGEPGALVKRLLGDAQLSPEELREIRELLEGK